MGPLFSAWPVYAQIVGRSSLLHPCLSLHRYHRASRFRWCQVRLHPSTSRRYRVLQASPVHQLEVLRLRQCLRPISLPTRLPRHRPRHQVRNPSNPAQADTITSRVYLRTGPNTRRLLTCLIHLRYHQCRRASKVTVNRNLLASNTCSIPQKSLLKQGSA